MSDVERPSWCVGVPHGPDEPCTCSGCWSCDAKYNDNYDKEHVGEFRPDMFFSSGGHVTGCTCDIEWECVYGNCVCPPPAPKPYWIG